MAGTLRHDAAWAKRWQWYCGDNVYRGGDVSEPVVSLITESTSVPAKAGATTVRAASFEVLETRLLWLNSSSLSRGRIHRYHVAEAVDNDLPLLLAINRARRSSRQEFLVHGRNEKNEYRADDDDSWSQIDEPLAVALIEWQ